MDKRRRLPKQLMPPPASSAPTSSSSSSRVHPARLYSMPLHLLEKVLECPVCKDIPFPPIYTCETGHMICNLCMKKVTRCTTCKRRVTTSRNFPLESIMLGATFYCSHRMNGCRVVATIIELQQHQKVCPSRPIKCHLSGQLGCRDSQLYLTQYVHHLIQVHKLPLVNPEPGTSNVFLAGFVIYNFEQVAEFLKKSRSWCSGLFEFDGRIFVTRVFSRGQLFFFKVAVVAESTDKSKYTARVTMVEPNQSGQSMRYMELQLNIQIPCIRELTSIEDSEELHGGLPVPVLERHGRFVKNPETSKIDLQWNVWYSISRNQDHPSSISI